MNTVMYISCSNLVPPPNQAQWNRACTIVQFAAHQQYLYVLCVSSMSWNDAHMLLLLLFAPAHQHLCTLVLISILAIQMGVRLKVF